MPAHERPTAAETEKAVPASEREAAAGAAAVMAHQKRAGVPAFGEATILQRRELN
jgi:hypothetical protein